MINHYISFINLQINALSQLQSLKYSSLSSFSSLSKKRVNKRRERAAFGENEEKTDKYYNDDDWHQPPLFVFLQEGEVLGDYFDFAHLNS